MHDDEWWPRLERYLAGDATADERSAIETWIAATPAAATWLREFRRVVPVAAPLPPQEWWDIDRAWSGVASQSNVSRARPWGKWLPHVHAWHGTVAAACLVGVIGLSIGGWTLRAGGHWRSPAQAYTTTAGQRLSLTLVDGTQLTLGPASRLTLAADYGTGTRRIFLQGEAYFAVVHDSAHPFTVETRDITVRDVGTEFSVQAYDGDQSVRVVVAQGQVNVGTAWQPVRLSSAATLSAGDMAIVANSHMIVTHKTDVAAEIAWFQGGLAFEDTPLRDVVRDVGRTFGVTITVADSALAGKLVTAKFASEPIDVVLDAVTQVVGAQYERKGSQIVIRNSATSAHSKDTTPRLPLTMVQAQDRRE